jgi:hypothetical protein
VDRVEFKLVVGGQLFAQWQVQGDTHYSAGSDAVIDCALFRTTVEGGWFSGRKATTVTKEGVDPALALLLAHLCYTEYSVAEIKRDLCPNTPSNAPEDFEYRAPADNLLMFGGSHTTGEFRWGNRL